MHRLVVITIYGSDRRQAVYTISYNTSNRVMKVDTVAFCRGFKNCGGGKYSVDCTTMKFGRKVTCEPLKPIFFPFTAEAATLPSRNALKYPLY
jgi:hypothetical protein